ncbi:MAG: hypothetical protein GC191_06235, partial [Azospirillum sp.]|nr:hypothetical protein [Azospirillum sp.]
MPSLFGDPTSLPVTSAPLQPTPSTPQAIPDTIPPTPNDSNYAGTQGESVARAPAQGSDAASRETIIERTSGGIGLNSADSGFGSDAAGTGSTVLPIPTAGGGGSSVAPTSSGSVSSLQGAAFDTGATIASPNNEPVLAGETIAAPPATSDVVTHLVDIGLDTTLSSGGETDARALAPVAVSGLEDTALVLELGLAGLAPSESLEVTVSGLPADATLSAG